METDGQGGLGAVLCSCSPRDIEKVTEQVPEICQVTATCSTKRIGRTVVRESSLERVAADRVWSSCTPLLHFSLQISSDYSFYRIISATFGFLCLSVDFQLTSGSYSFFLAFFLEKRFCFSYRF